MDLSAFFSRNFQSAKLIGRAYCGIANFGSENVLINPATGFEKSDFSILFFGSKGEFDLDELGFKGVQLNSKYNSINLNFGVNIFGDKNYSELNYTINYANEILEEIYFGLNVNLHSLKIANYGTSSKISFDGGLIYALNEKYKIGVSVINPTREKISKSKIDLPQIYILGINYEPLEHSFFEWNIVHQISEKISHRVGLKYELSKHFNFSSGFETEPKLIFLGISVMNDFGSIDYATKINKEIGNTHIYTIKINF